MIAGADDSRELFDRLQGMATGERASIVDEACEGESSLRSRVQSIFSGESENGNDFAILCLDHPELKNRLLQHYDDWARLQSMMGRMDTDAPFPNPGTR